MNKCLSDHGHRRLPENLALTLFGEAWLIIVGQGDVKREIPGKALQPNQIFTGIAVFQELGTTFRKPVPGELSSKIPVNQ